MASSHQPLPGFRDFAPRERLLSRYLFDCWTAVARRYGFSEYEAPILESAELYLKKSGGEISEQLFRFTDKGDRDVVLRPELTASLVRMVAAHQRDYPKPLKWFEIGRCFRHEAVQRGRLREFYQFNADILGEASPAADAELIALAIDVMRELGFQEGEFVVRLSDRETWQNFCADQGVRSDQLDQFLAVVDKLARESEDKLRDRLQAFGVSLETVREFVTNGAGCSENLSAVLADLAARGLGGFAQVDLSVVRGLAYYTGVVFEVFDSAKALRSVAGGGRYDSLLSIITDGSTDLPATGYAMGDCVIAELIQETPQALVQFEAWRQRQAACEVYLVIADESHRSDALGLVSTLRGAGIRCDYSLAPSKINKQFKAAGQSLARFALVVGSEFPELKLKNLNARSEESLPPNANVVEILKVRLGEPDGPLIA